MLEGKRYFIRLQAGGTGCCLYIGTFVSEDAFVLVFRDVEWIQNTGKLETFFRTGVATETNKLVGSKQTEFSRDKWIESSEWPH